MEPSQALSTVHHAVRVKRIVCLYVTTLYSTVQFSAVLHPACPQCGSVHLVLRSARPYESLNRGMASGTTKSPNVPCLRSLVLYSTHCVCVSNIQSSAVWSSWRLFALRGVLYPHAASTKSMPAAGVPLRPSLGCQILYCAAVDWAMTLRVVLQVCSTVQHRTVHTVQFSVVLYCTVSTVHSAQRSGEPSSRCTLHENPPGALRPAYHAREPAHLAGAVPGLQYCTVLCCTVSFCWSPHDSALRLLQCYQVSRHSICTQR